MAPNGLKWLKMTPNGLNWLEMAPKVLHNSKKKRPKGAKKVP